MTITGPLSTLGNVSLIGMHNFRDIVYAIELDTDSEIYETYTDDGYFKTYITKLDDYVEYNYIMNKDFAKGIKTFYHFNYDTPIAGNYQTLLTKVDYNGSNSAGWQYINNTTVDLNGSLKCRDCYGYSMMFSINGYILTVFGFCNS